MEERIPRVQRLRGHTGGEFDPDFILDSKGVESPDSENSLKRAPEERACKLFSGCKMWGLRQGDEHPGCGWPGVGCEHSDGFPIPTRPWGATGCFQVNLPFSLTYEDHRPDCRDWAREKQTGDRKVSEITDTKLYGDFSLESGSIN